MNWNWMSRRSASSCFNRVWRVTKSSAKHQSMLRPWVMQHQPWPSPSAWTKTRSLHGCRNFYLLILPSLSFSLSFSLSLLLLILHRTDVCSPLLCLFPTQFRAKIDFSRIPFTFRAFRVSVRAWFVHSYEPHLLSASWALRTTQLQAPDETRGGGGGATWNGGNVPLSSLAITADDAADAGLRV